MGTIRENGKAAALVLRLRVEAGRIAEAETLVLRNDAINGSPFQNLNCVNSSSPIPTVRWDDRCYLP
jgi:hypothetical protein